MDSHDWSRHTLTLTLTDPLPPSPPPSQPRSAHTHHERRQCVSQRLHGRRKARGEVQDAAIDVPRGRRAGRRRRRRHRHVNGNHMLDDEAALLQVLFVRDEGNELTLNDGGPGGVGGGR